MAAGIKRGPKRGGLLKFRKETEGPRLEMETAGAMSLARRAWGLTEWQEVFLPKERQFWGGRLSG
jgi:hypothetical protein